MLFVQKIGGELLTKLAALWTQGKDAVEAPLAPEASQLGQGVASLEQLVDRVRRR
jgi:hypothetical protein